MSIFNKSLVVSIGESVGVTIKDDVAAVLIEDAEYRLREVIHESIKFMKHSNRKRVSSRDINSALVVKNVQPLYGFTNFDHSFKSTVYQNQALYYIDDAEIDLEELINRPLPAVPLEVTFTAHWLAIEGVQPRIVQNPTLNDRNAEKDKLANLLPNKNVKNIDIPLVKQVLTQELQLYFEKVTEAIQSEEPRLQALAIESLSGDPGIQALMPYFVVFISDQVTNNLKHLHTTMSMMIMVSSLFKNPHLFLDPYLHQILPAVITCVVAKHLSPTQDHWSLRRNASVLLRTISENSSTTYPALQARITKTLVKALLDPSKHVATVYGALYALFKMGPEVVDLLIVPHASALASRIEGEETKELMVVILKNHHERHSGAKLDFNSLYGIFATEVLGDTLMTQ